MLLDGFLCEDGEAEILVNVVRPRRLVHMTRAHRPFVVLTALMGAWPGEGEGARNSVALVNHEDICCAREARRHIPVETVLRTQQRYVDH